LLLCYHGASLSAVTANITAILASKEGGEKNAYKGIDDDHSCSTLLLALLAHVVCGTAFLASQDCPLYDSCMILSAAHRNSVNARLRATTTKMLI
jgi:hypothetical protein